MRLPYVEHGDPDGVPVILLHAYADSLRFFEPLLERLPESVRAIAPSLRGHGDAPRPDTGYRLEDFAGDVLELMDALGLPAAHLVGQSSGGYLAQRIALDHPDRTLGLVLLASPRDFRDKPKGLVDAVSRLVDPVGVAFVRDFLESTMGGSVPAAHVETMVAESARVPARVWRDTLQGLLEADVPVESGTIAARALVVAGELDSICPPAEQQALADAIPGARLVTYPGVGHLVAAEAPARVAADIAAFTGVTRRAAAARGPARRGRRRG